MGVVVRLGSRSCHRQVGILVSEPCLWLTGHERVLPRTGDALDVACGRGRHAFWMAARGLRTRAVDADQAAIAFVNARAATRELPLRAEVVDLEDGSFRLETASCDLVVGVHYLHRPLFPSLVEALRPGGMLVYETFTRAQATRGKPTNPDFLLEPGELRGLVDGLDVLAYREGDYDGRFVASVIARRPRAT